MKKTAKQAREDNRKFWIKSVCHRLMRLSENAKGDLSDTEFHRFLQGLYTLAAGIIEAEDRDINYSIILGSQQRLPDFEESDDAYAIEE